MKYLVAFLLVCAPAMAKVRTARIDMSVTNITSSFVGANAKVLSLTSAEMIDYSGIIIENRSSSEISLACTSVANTIPADSVNYQIYVNGNTAYSIDAADLGLVKGCYMRSMTGSTLASGKVVLLVKGTR